MIEGMQHLMTKAVVHRDLAARNVLLASGKSSTGYVARIADFGLSRISVARSPDAGGYYQSAAGVFALRWTAPEAFEQLKFTQASDVWAFGIVMVEIFQNGMLPYHNLATKTEVLALILSGQRHSKPPACPSHMHTLLLKCWDSNVNNRPTFSELSAEFSARILMMLTSQKATMPQRSPACAIRKAAELGGHLSRVTNFTAHSTLSISAAASSGYQYSGLTVDKPTLVIV
jgi:serine/threonine protein kinase